jgi:hypothetical protein
MSITIVLLKPLQEIGPLPPPLTAATVTPFVLGVAQSVPLHARSPYV